MTNRLVYSLKVKKITLRQCGQFIKKIFHPAATPETSILFLALLFVPEYLKTKKMCKNAVKK